MRRILSVCLVLVMTLLPVGAVSGSPTLSCASAVLMEKETGTVLFEENAHEKLEPASVTKVMTLLLIMEAVDSGRIGLSDMVSVSANAAGMGGSQVFLKEGEQMSVEEMLKAIAVVSGNDAAVAMAEHLAGSEAGFVEQMNAKAVQLGMNDTHFENCTGLPAAGHLTSAYDIALMSRELIDNHPGVQTYTTIWMDTIRDGAFQLSNTNKLVRYYEGTTGLKTGSTDSALYCLSATAQREGMELIAVVMKGESSDLRFESAKSMLDFGFANYTLMHVQPERAMAPVDVLLGQLEQVQPVLSGEGKILVDKAQMNGVTTRLNLATDVEAPVLEGQKLGEMEVLVEGEVVQTLPIVASQGVERLTTLQIFQQFVQGLFLAQG